MHRTALGSQQIPLRDEEKQNQEREELGVKNISEPQPLSWATFNLIYLFIN